MIGALVVYALVGTSRHLGVGPEPGTAILAAAGVASIAGGDPQRYIALMAALALVVAAICIVGAVARLGFLASMLSKPVLVGYITGVGLTLLSSQIASFTGVPITSDTFFARFGELLTQPRRGPRPDPRPRCRHPRPHPGAAAVRAAGARCARRCRRRPPVVVAVFALDEQGSRSSGRSRAACRSPGSPTCRWATSAGCCRWRSGSPLVGYTDNVLTARSIATRHGYRIDANQELLALGLTNLSAGLSQGFPVSSSASRTAVPASLGSKTQLVSLVASGFVVVTLLVFCARCSPRSPAPRSRR